MHITHLWTPSRLMAAVLFIPSLFLTTLRSGPLLQEAFNGSDGEPIAGRAPAVSNIPAVKWVSSYQGGIQPTISTVAGNAAPAGRIGFNNSAYLDLSSAGAYLKPVVIVIGADICVGTLTGPVATGAGIGLGFYGDTPPSGSNEATQGFSGLLVNQAGTISLMTVTAGNVKTVHATTSPLPGFSPGDFYRLSYRVDTGTGRISNVWFGGVDYSAVFAGASGLFSDTATHYAGIYGRSNVSTAEYGHVDNFQVDSPVSHAVALTTDSVLRSWTGDQELDSTVSAWVPSGNVTLGRSGPTLPIPGYTQVIRAAAGSSPIMAVTFKASAALANTAVRFTYYVPSSVTVPLLSLNLRPLETGTLYKGKVILKKDQWVTETWLLSEIIGGDTWRLGNNRTISQLEFAFDGGDAAAQIQLAEVQLISKANAFGTPADMAYPPVPQVISSFGNSTTSFRSGTFAVGSSLSTAAGSKPWIQILAWPSFTLKVNGATVGTGGPVNLDGTTTTAWPHLGAWQSAREFDLSGYLIAGQDNQVEVVVPPGAAGDTHTGKAVCALGWVEANVRKVMTTDGTWTASPAAGVTVEGPLPLRNSLGILTNSQIDIFPIRAPQAWSSAFVARPSPDIPQASLGSAPLARRNVVENPGGAPAGVAKWEAVEFNSGTPEARWFFKDPSGLPYFLLSTQAVVLDSFNYGYYRWALRQFPNENAWATECLTWQRNLGFNSITVASTPSTVFNIGAGMGMHNLQIISPQAGGPYLQNAAGVTTNMPDPFDADWRSRYAATVEARASSWNRNDAVIGYYIGNEIQFVNGGLSGNTYPGYVYSNAAGQQFQSFLAARYANSISTLNQAWNKNFASFAQILTDKPDPYATGTPAQMLQDFQDFCAVIVTEFANYARQMRDTYMPNKVLFSQRFIGTGTAAMLKAFSACDVIALNVYPYISGLGQNQFTQGQLNFITLVHTATGKPVILSEWGCASLDTRLSSDRATTLTQAERGVIYGNIIQQLYSLPFVIGSSNFQWQDMPDNERMNWGMVNSGGLPYLPYMEGIKAAHEWLDNRFQSFRDASVPSFSDFQETHFDELEREDPLVASGSADPDGDGMPNLLEYALGLNPRVSDSAGAVMLGRTEDGQRLTLTFNRIADPELAYVIEATNDLASGEWETVFASTGAENTDGPITVEDTELIADHSRRFLRLKITEGQNTPVYTAPVGYVRHNLLHDSDTHIGFSMVRPAIFVGRITSIEGNTLGLDGAVFENGSLAYEPQTRPDTHYLQILSGSAIGHSSTVLDNEGEAVTTEFESDIISLLQVGDRVAIRPYWTLATLLPPSDAGQSYIASINNFPAGRRTEVIIPDIHSTGINRSASVTCFFKGSWRMVGAVAADYGNTPFLPDAPLVIRGNNYSDDTILRIFGEIPPSSQIISLRTLVGQQNDNPVGLSLPVDITLAGLTSLVGENGAFKSSASNFPAGRGDELLVFDNLLQARNKSASATYFHNGFWRKVGAVGSNQGTVVLPAGSVIVIRKQAGESAAVNDWKLEYTP